MIINGSFSSELKNMKDTWESKRMPTFKGSGNTVDVSLEACYYLRETMEVRL